MTARHDLKAQVIEAILAPGEALPLLHAKNSIPDMCQELLATFHVLHVESPYSGPEVGRL